MNKQIMYQLGMAKVVERVEHGFCATCGKPVSNDWQDELSQREYKISGMCQVCQDSVFNAPEDPCVPCTEGNCKDCIVTQ